MSRISSNFAALGFGEALARLAAFGATVYLARHLGPALYGIVGVAGGAMLYFAQLADGGIELTGVPAIARDRDRVIAIASPVLTIRIALAALLALVLAVVGIWFLPQPDGAILAGSALALVFAGASTRWIHIGLERTGWVAVARTIGELVALLLVVLLVREPGNVGLVPVAQFAGAAATSLLLLTSLRRLGYSFPVRFDWAAARPMFARSRFLVGFTLLGLLLFNFDLIFLRVVSGASAAGHYAAAYTLISFAANLIVAYAHTVLPALSRLDHEADVRGRLFRTSMAQAFVVALPVAIGGQLVAARVIDLLFGPGFAPGVVALQWLIWTVPLAALRELPVVALIAAGAERVLLRVNGVTAAANVVLVVLLVPRFGLVGAAVATVATEIIRLALAATFASRAGYQSVGPERLWKAAVAGAAMAGAVVALGTAQLWIVIPAGAVAYAGALLALGAVRLSRSGPPELRV